MLQEGVKSAAKSVSSGPSHSVPLKFVDSFSTIMWKGSWTSVSRRIGRIGRRCRHCQRRLLYIPDKRQGTVTVSSGTSTTARRKDLKH